MGDLLTLLGQLYERQLKMSPDDEYLRQHAAPRFLHGTFQVFRFYEPYVPQPGAILDWGCHHAPDACLLRARFGENVELHGCDIIEEDRYRVFHDYAGLRYERLRSAIELPYADAAFDAVIASGVLEHVPMDYESLKELHRVLKPGGRLIVTYLPNVASIEEWRLRSRSRDGSGFHRRLYTRRELRSMLLHSGFLPRVAGYQTQLDTLPPDGTRPGPVRMLLRAAGMHRIVSCLCAVAEKTVHF